MTTTDQQLTIPCCLCTEVHPATQVVTQRFSKVDLLVCDQRADEYRSITGYRVKPLTK